MKTSKENKAQEVLYAAEEFQTKATISETIELKFFQQLNAKKFSGLSKKLEESNRHLSQIESNVNLTDIKLSNQIEQLSFKMDQTLSHINTFKDESQKIQQKIETFNINISKCYEDILEFKDHMGDLITSFKIEVYVNQETILKDLLNLQEQKKTNSFDVEKNRQLLEKFDLKLEQYKSELTNKMESFNPLDFNLMEKDFFNQEMQKTYNFIRERCQDLASQVRHLEKFVNVVESMQDKSELPQNDKILEDEKSALQDVQNDIGASNIPPQISQKTIIQREIMTQQSNYNNTTQKKAFFKSQDDFYDGKISVQNRKNSNIYSQQNQLMGSVYNK
ncbi:UNKNOWN [Stylonychia lemnae]|uniref:Uncharacterized protein n=1 Tax=Stylonychia lemnae TaxID=5949 RepID=A0A078AD71_STYLE|nr:UNKNOWN [Stylonychia lemnae]|eukprot:CDW80189.1 UNKNOWN [Stylonychia lemnae]